MRRNLTGWTTLAMRHNARGSLYHKTMPLAREGSLVAILNCFRSTLAERFLLQTRWHPQGTPANLE